MNKKSSGIAIGGGIAIAVIAIAVFMLSGMPNEQEPIGNVVDDADKNNVTVQEDDDKVRVLASFYPYYEFTRNVVGDSAIVEQYLPSGIEAHDWEPRAQEIQSLKNADVFVYNGLGMEPYVENMIDSGEFDNVLFVKASEEIEMMKFDEEGHDETHSGEFVEEIEEIIEELEHGHITESQTLEEIEETLHEHEGDGHEHGNKTIESIEEILHEIKEGHVSQGEGIEEIHHVILDIEGQGDHGDEEKEEGHEHDFEFDPHIWLDPVLVKQQVNNIKDGLIKADPQNKEHYEQNAMQYNKELDVLDTKIKSSLSSCDKDTFVPFHNAFTYLGDRYGLKIMALSGIAPDSEASAAEIAEFVDFVKDNDIKVIFAEELVDPRLAQVIADEAGAEVLLFSPIEALTQDEVGQNITYIDKMEKNLDALKVALECQ